MQKFIFKVKLKELVENNISNRLVYIYGFYSHKKKKV